MVSWDGKIKATFYFLHCTCLYILTFKYEYVFIFIFKIFPFSSISSPKTVLDVLQTFHFILKKSRGWVVQKLGLGRDHLRRGLRLETGLCSCLMMVHWGLKEQFMDPKLLTFLLCTVVWVLLVDRWVRDFWKYGWCVHLTNIWVPYGYHTLRKG